MSVPHDEHGKQDVAAGEELCRRIPVSLDWYDTTHKEISRQAFRPRPEDTTGLSLYRRRFQSAEDLAQQGRSPDGYWVAILTVGDLQAAGIELQCDNPSDPSHVILPDLRADNKKTNEGLELMEKLARLVRRVDGPFPSGQSG